MTNRKSHKQFRLVPKSTTRSISRGFRGFLAQHVFLVSIINVAAGPTTVIAVLHIKLPRFSRIIEIGFLGSLQFLVLIDIANFAAFRSCNCKNSKNRIYSIFAYSYSVLDNYKFLHTNALCRLRRGCLLFSNY